MRCPYCGAGAGFNGFAPTLGQVGLLMVERDITNAAVWARDSSETRSLQAFLQSKEGSAFKNFWTHEEVIAADLNATQQQE
jgi:hypothetical protein